MVEKRMKIIKTSFFNKLLSESFIAIL
jgi:hypothetical protein